MSQECYTYNKSKISDYYEQEGEGRHGTKENFEEDERLQN